jgi:hypothetical protein
MRRIIHDKDFINFVMTPPRMTNQEYEMYEPKTSTIRVVNDRGTANTGLGDLPVVGPVQGMFGGNDWVMPVVIIVVSAMALMTLYAVISKR